MLLNILDLCPYCYIEKVEQDILGAITKIRTKKYMEDSNVIEWNSLVSSIGRLLFTERSPLHWACRESIGMRGVKGAMD